MLNCIIFHILLPWALATAIRWERNLQFIVSYCIWYNQKPWIFKVFASLVDNTITCMARFKMWLTMRLKSSFSSQEWNKSFYSLFSRKAEKLRAWHSYLQPPSSKCHWQILFWHCTQAWILVTHSLKGAISKKLRLWILSFHIAAPRSNKNGAGRKLRNGSMEGKRHKIHGKKPEESFPWCLLLSWGGQHDSIPLRINITT